MDTITYLPDPGNQCLMVNIITDHSCFMQAHVRVASPQQAQHYDSYDKSNDCTSYLAFLMLISEMLHNKVKDQIPDNPMFHLVWMLFIQTLQSDPVICFKKVQEEIEKMKPQAFAGQDITKMALAITKHCQVLTSAGVFDQQINGHIICTFLLAEGDSCYNLHFSPCRHW